MDIYRSCRKKKMICCLISLINYSRHKIITIYTWVFAPTIIFYKMRYLIYKYFQNLSYYGVL